MRCTAILALCLTAILPAAEPDGLEIARRCDAALKGKSQRGTASMTVHRPEWERTLEMNFWYVNPHNSFIRITAPAKEAGSGSTCPRSSGS
jgi:hypothetical protein